jgi:peptide/nickel transport system ATP-binding protein
LIKELKQKFGLSYIFITHDLATEAEIADRIVVMYAGKIVEIGTNQQIFGDSEQKHPYTQKLLAATPRLHEKVSELAFIPGAPPDLINPPVGCRFAPRCPFVKPLCLEKEPEIVDVSNKHSVACFKIIKDNRYE